MVQKPDFVEHVVVEEADSNRNSLFVIDNIDERRISPFQNWLLDEIMANAASSINVLTERDQVMQPNSGYHCPLFANYMLEGIKAVLVFTMSSKTGNPCAQWDSYASRSLSLSAFQPFTVHMDGHARHFGHLCGCQGLQRQCGPVPPGVQRIPVGL